MTDPHARCPIAQTFSLKANLGIRTKNIEVLLSYTAGTVNDS